MGEDTDGQGASWGAGEALSSGRLLLAFPMKGEVRASKSEQLGKPVRLLRRVKKGQNNHCGGWRGNSLETLGRKYKLFCMLFIQMLPVLCQDD